MCRRATVAGSRGSRAATSSGSATQMYPWASHAHDDQSYWVTSEMAATIMNVDPGQVELALAGERAPHLVHQDGTKMYRRHQVTEIAEHRAKRWGVPTTN